MVFGIREWNSGDLNLTIIILLLTNLSFHCFLILGLKYSQFIHGGSVQRTVNGQISKNRMRIKSLMF